MNSNWSISVAWSAMARTRCIAICKWQSLLLLVAASGLAILLGAQSANAATSCGVTGQATGAPSITYNPFDPSGINQVSIPLTLTRFANGGAKTQSVNFVLTKPIGAPDYVVLYQGANVLYTQGATAGHPVSGSLAPGEIYYLFGGASAPNQSTPFNLVVSIPPNVDLSAGEPIAFDILYVCKGTGGMADLNSPTSLTGAIHIDVNVQSAVQASYVGSPLNFGDITNLSLVSANTHTTGGAIRVASSGPFAVTLDAQNRFRLTYPGGDPDVMDSSVRYSATFVGQTRSIAQPETISVKCSSSGIHGQNLPILLRLIDGGADKIPSANYRDVLTVTVTPLATLGAQPPTNCSGL